MSFDIATPIFIANNYIWSEMKKLDQTLVTKYQNIVPFFPINDATAGSSQWGDKPYFVYNRAFRLSGEFYEIKKETFIYSLKATIDDTFQWTYALQKIIDRQDDAASDVNEWNKNNGNGPVSFHSFKLYQSAPLELRDSTIAPLVVSTFLVNVDYHLL